MSQKKPASKEELVPFTFDGFIPSNTTPVPDILFDEIIPHLSEAEIKVLLFVIRRTLGFKKTTDAISLNQFQKGIVKKTGEVLNYGCGVKDRATILKALRSLEKKKCVKSEKKVNADGSHAPTVYSIYFKGVVGPANQGGSGASQPGGSGASQPGGSGASQPTRNTNTRNTNTREREKPKPEVEKSLPSTALSPPFLNDEKETPSSSVPDALEPPIEHQVEEVYTALDAFKQETGKPQDHYVRSEEGTTAIITKLLVQHPTPERIHKVCLDMWNEKDRDGKHFWRNKMTVKVICNQYESRIMALESKGTLSPTTRSGESGDPPRIHGIRDLSASLLAMEKKYGHLRQQGGTQPNG